MNTATLLTFVALVAGPPAATTPPTDVQPAEIVAPTILEVASDEVILSDGLHARWSSATYEIASGQEAEVFVEVDEHGRGEAMISVDGEPLLRATTDGGHLGRARC